jgi:hypothetical protein
MIAILLALRSEKWLVSCVQPNYNPQSVIIGTRSVPA